jgi:hypothetical protein
VGELLDAVGVRDSGDGTFLRPDGTIILKFDAGPWQTDPAVCRMKALAAAVREQSGHAQ